MNPVEEQHIAELKVIGLLYEIDKLTAERDAALSGYENLLADTNGEIAGLRAKLEAFRAGNRDLQLHFDVAMGALTTERARVVELEAENAKPREPDWFWDIDSPEYGASDVEDLADMSGETAVVMELGCALTLPSFWMAATYHDRTGWNATRHETREEAEAAVIARQALQGDTE